MKAIQVKYRNSMGEIVAQAGLPHDLPDHAEMSALSKDVNTGPKKPALERVFKPMGYNVSGGTGSGQPNGGCQFNFTVAGNVNQGGNKYDGITLSGSPIAVACKN